MTLQDLKNYTSLPNLVEAFDENNTLDDLCQEMRVAVPSLASTPSPSDSIILPISSPLISNNSSTVSSSVSDTSSTSSASLHDPSFSSAFGHLGPAIDFALKEDALPITNPSTFVDNLIKSFPPDPANCAEVHLLNCLEHVRKVVTKKINKTTKKLAAKAKKESKVTKPTLKANEYYTAHYSDQIKSKGIKKLTERAMTREVLTYQLPHEE